ncbi:sensor histidine kinase [Enterovirga rhinocerotis]|uniref:histidine kinase n=1 Tax=Enterovirga rhinocerotis TaxID=1339210 RepID=A0A4V3DWN2_9HYPH|nr:histidine kinase dimerization/phosphoacceptor domain -containing protein [Enterovirga rhinocerotis]TDR85509.1 two-component sensor histidine kinase [Enterovirga rhinocerotis]
MTESLLRLLYIDDDPGLARLVQKNLGRRGFDVDTAQDGAAGLARLREGAFDAVALDHYMPGQDGLAVLCEITSLPDPPPVVYVTGTQESSVAVAALKAGASDYVVKTAGGEFIHLLEAAIGQAIRSVRLRREKEAAEAEVRAARDRFEALAAERALLIREVNHRVGNSLQIIAALLHLQSSTTASEDVKSALAAANRRVMAVAQVHRRLYTSDDVQAVALDQYLKTLVDDLRGSAEGDGGGDELTLAAEPCEVGPDKAVAVGVVVTELVLNALKYAYPDGRGPIRVSLVKRDAGRIALSVEDDGVGRDLKTGRTEEGLGRMIVRAMAVKLGADWGRDESHPGMKVTLTFETGQAAA